MGEELILFAAAIGTTLLLRDAREEEADRREDVARADSLRLVGLGLVGATVVLGLYVVAHGVVTPGGGFQGGVVLAAALALVFLAGGYKTYRSVSPTPLVDFGEGLAIVWYVGLGLATLGVGAQFLENVLPLGTAGTLASSGTIIVLAVASGLAVAAGFVLLFTEFLEEYMLDAHRGDG
jgi:multicomponent Na+:H+ antiporter subunit B